MDNCLYTVGVRFEWDLPKARANLLVHGVSFAEAVTVLEDDSALTRDDPDDIDERRFVSLGLSTRVRNYGNVCWWAPRMIQSARFPILVVATVIRLVRPTSPSGAGGAALSALSLLLDDGWHRLRRRFAHPGPPRSAHTLP